MKISGVVFALVIVCLMGKTAFSNPNIKPTSAPSRPTVGVNDYLRLLAKPWKKSPSEHAKTKNGRSILRKYVTNVRLAYKGALDECNNDPLQLNKVLRDKWNFRMFDRFRHPLHLKSTLSEEFRESAQKFLPYKLRRAEYQQYPYDPYIDDPSFLHRVFNLRASWRSFQFDFNLSRVFERYWELWMERYGESKLLLSETIYLWLEANLERIISLVTEWEIAGLESDEEDVWTNEIPEDKVHSDVSELMDNDNLYHIRMFYHDHSKNDHLFYGLPEGTRQPSIVPRVAVDLSEAQRNLTQVASRLHEFKGDKGMADLARVANQYLRAVQGAINEVISPDTDPDSCLSDEPSCSKWGDEKAGQILECAAIEIHLTNPKGRSSRIDRHYSPSRDSGIFSGGSTRSNSRSSPRRFNLDSNWLESGLDYFPENDGSTSSSDSEIANSTGRFATRYALNELVDDCVDDLPEDTHKRSKRTLLDDTPPQVLRYERIAECKKSVSQRIKACVAKLRGPLVKDPMTLVHNSSKVVKDKESLSVSCDDNQVLFMADSQVFVQNFFRAAFESIGLLFIPAIAYHEHSEDMGIKALTAMKKKCNKEAKCSIDVDIEKMSGHTSVLDLGVQVIYQCAPYGCNPNLYEEKTVSADEDDQLDWQCAKDEAMFITGAQWNRKDGFWEGVKTVFEAAVPLIFFDANNEDMNLKFLEHTRKFCNGKNRCNQKAALEDVTGHSTNYKVYVEVKYKCLPCKQFLLEA